MGYDKRILKDWPRFSFLLTSKRVKTGLTWVSPSCPALFQVKLTFFFFKIILILFYPTEVDGSFFTTRHPSTWIILADEIWGHAVDTTREVVTGTLVFVVTTLEAWLQDVPQKLYLESIKRLHKKHNLHLDPSGSWSSHHWQVQSLGVLTFCALKLRKIFLRVKCTTL